MHLAPNEAKDVTMLKLSVREFTRKLTLPLLGLVMAAVTLTFPATASAEVFKTHFFTVDLGNTWHVQGRAQNMPHSVNVNLVNPGVQSSVNIVVGSGQIHPTKLLTDLQRTLVAQHAKVKPIERQGDLLYFEFILNGIKGYSCAGTNGKDVSSITILGKPEVAFRMLHTLKAKDKKLFPPLNR